MTLREDTVNNLLYTEILNICSNYNKTCASFTLVNGSGRSENINPMTSNPNAYHALSYMK